MDEGNLRAKFDVRAFARMLNVADPFESNHKVHFPLLGYIQPANFPYYPCQTWVANQSHYPLSVASNFKHRQIHFYEKFIFLLYGVKNLDLYVPTIGFTSKLRQIPTRKAN